MPFIDLSRMDLTTGHAIIDEQHQRIFGLMDEAYSLFLNMKDNASTFEFVLCLIALKEYLDYHFEEEEEAIALMNYPNLIEHIQKHYRMQSEVGSLIERLIDDKNPNIKFIGKKLLIILRDLFLEHIITEDKPCMLQCALSMQACRLTH